jgi:transcriptional regulator with XRE-family HTH domain|tara:strand:+ start:31 stop:330 length:300 start_codon:yes stop_codon:yes gene_type:complete
MHKRLETWMDIEGLKSSKLADNIGVNRATISHILSARNKPSIDFLNKLLRAYPNLNANWLISGIGYMYENKNIQENISDKSINRITVFYDDQSFDEIKA